MLNYTRVIAASSTNIRTPTTPEINQGNDHLAPYESDKNNGYYNEMSQAINNASTELTNLISSSGQTPGSALNQVEQAIAGYAAQGGVFCIDSGIANTYVITQISPFIAPPILTNGMSIKFRPLNSNTGASTINPFGLGVANIKQADGITDPIANQIAITQDVELRYDGTVWRLTNSADIATYMIVRDEKATNTPGGTPITTAFNTRTLNTVAINTIAGASLSGNQITLPAGEFYIKGRTPGYALQGHQAFIYNVTDSIYSLTGESANTNISVGTSNFSEVEGIITIASPKVFELRQYVGSNGGAGTGLGASANSGLNEVYSNIYIHKIK